MAHVPVVQIAFLLSVLTLDICCDCWSNAGSISSRCGRRMESRSWFSWIMDYTVRSPMSSDWNMLVRSPDVQGPFYN